METKTPEKNFRISEKIHLLFSYEEDLYLDFALQCFRNCIVGEPNIEKITDHEPLHPIFNTHRQGSIRTGRIKLHHQDIN